MKPSDPVVPRPEQIQQLGPARPVRPGRPVGPVHALRAGRLPPPVYPLRPDDGPRTVGALGPGRAGWAGQPRAGGTWPPGTPLGPEPPIAPVAPVVPAPAGLSPLKALEGVLLLLPLLLLPVVALWFVKRPVLVEHSRLERYREVQAIVVRTGVERRPPSDGHSAPAFVPRVTFRYVVGGKLYQADRLTSLDVSGPERWADKRVEPYHEGEVVRAYYDPQNPKRAFLERRATGALTATFFLPVPMLALALLWVAHVRRKQQRAAAARRPALVT